VVENVSVAMVADLVDEIVAQSSCIKRFATNVESHARCLSDQPVVSRCIAILVLEVKGKPEIIEAGVDSEVILVKEIMMS